MAITQVGTITGPVTVSNANLTVTEPAGCQTDDYLVVWIAHKSAIGYQALNGWIKLQDQSIGNIDSTDGIASGELFYIKRGASAPNLTFTKETGTGDVAMGRCAAFRGIHTTDPIRASTSSTAAIGATVATASALSALVGDLCFMGLAGGDNYSFSAEQINGIPTTLTELADSGTNTGSDTANAVATLVLAADITSQTLQGTCSGALGRNVIAAAYFKPAPVAYTMPAAQGSFALAGQAIGLNKGYKLAIEYGSFSLAGQAIGFKRGYNLSAACGDFTLAGQSVGLNQGYVIFAACGSFALAGQDVAFHKGYAIIPAYGLLALNGQTVGLKVARILSITYGSFSLAGQTIGLRTDRKLAADYGSFMLTGQDVTLTYTPVGGYILVAGTGNFTLAGQNVGLKAPVRLVAEHGAFILAGQDANLIYYAGAYILVAGIGNFILTLFSIQMDQQGWQRRQRWQRWQRWQR